MSIEEQIAREAATRVSHGLYNRVGNRIGLGLSELRHELEILESDEHIILAAIKRAVAIEREIVKQGDLQK